MIRLRRPAQYSELLQQVEQHFGRHLLMECVIRNGEVCNAALVLFHMSVAHVFSQLCTLIFFPRIYSPPFICHSSLKLFTSRCTGLLVF